MLCHVDADVLGAEHNRWLMKTLDGTQPGWGASGKEESERTE